MKRRLAYIDDNRDNLDCMKLVLAENYDVKTYQNPLKFIAAFKPDYFSAILIDIHMPVLDGFSLYEKILEKDGYNGCPIVFISSDNSHATRIKSFDLGAVDFLDRHLSHVELTSRLKSQIDFFLKHRRIIEMGNIKLNLTLLKAYIDDSEIKLTFIEFKLLNFLIKSFPDPIHKDALMEAVWFDTHVLDATVYTHTFNLNTKVTAWDYEVVTERSKGTLLQKKNKVS
jgi:DNA-binding response OmpR family regulator